MNEPAIEAPAKKGRYVPIGERLGDKIEAQKVSAAAMKEMAFAGAEGGAIQTPAKPQRKGEFTPNSIAVEDFTEEAVAAIARAAKEESAKLISEAAKGRKEIKEQARKAKEEIKSTPPAKVAVAPAKPKTKKVKASPVNAGELSGADYSRKYSAKGAKKNDKGVFVIEHRVKKGAKVETKFLTVAKVGSSRRSYESQIKKALAKGVKESDLKEKYNWVAYYKERRAEFDRSNQ